MFRSDFPSDFLWGVATSSQQIEGAVATDGRSASIWDRLASLPGKIEDGTTPKTACDHYHRWREDLDLIDTLGFNAYRFSIAWPRVLPAGIGPINRAGVDFYERIVDTLLDRGITPFVTLYHWDLPQVLQDRGGWTERSTADAFVEYTAAVTQRLGDRVKHWVTHNEPWCIAHLGHESGHHAPGITDPPAGLRAAHHVLLSHGWAVPVIRDNSPGAQVGIVLNLTPAEPVSDRREDEDAARWFDGFFNRWYLDPIFRGYYPDDAINDRIERNHLDSATLPFVATDDMKAISTPLDFLGVNYYSRVVMRQSASGKPEVVPVVPPEQLTDMGWEVYPQGIRELLVRIHREYAPRQIFVTENGCAYSDSPSSSGEIEDDRRISYHRTHLAEIANAIEQGAPVTGYFAWSLLDNFEWAHGFTKRFGLVWVDYESLERIPKNSAYWFRDFLAAKESV